MKPKFRVGDRVYAIALPDAFPSPRAEVEGLTVVSVQKVECTSMPPYYRVLAKGKGEVQSVEGAERFFEFEAEREELTITVNDHRPIRRWNFDRWKRSWESRKRRAARIIYKALAEGRQVTEEWEDRETVWPDAANRCFVESARTPGYLTGHIVSRMFGWGLTVRVQKFV